MVLGRFAKPLSRKRLVGSNPTASAFARRSELRRTKSAIVGREGEIVRHQNALAKKEFAHHVLRLYSQMLQW